MGRVQIPKFCMLVNNGLMSFTKHRLNKFKETTKAEAKKSMEMPELDGVFALPLCQIWLLGQ